MADPIGTAVPPGGQGWRWEWQLHARCRGRGELFFHPPREREPARGQRQDAALALCRACPVRRLCLEHALMSMETYGVWGGTTEGDRQSLLYGARAPRRRDGAGGRDRAANYYV